MYFSRTETWTDYPPRCCNSSLTVPAVGSSHQSTSATFQTTFQTTRRASCLKHFSGQRTDLSQAKVRNELLFFFCCFFFFYFARHSEGWGSWGVVGAGGGRGGEGGGGGGLSEGAGSHAPVNPQQRLMCSRCAFASESQAAAHRSEAAAHKY